MLTLFDKYIIIIITGNAERGVAVSITVRMTTQFAIKILNAVGSSLMLWVILRPIAGSHRFCVGIAIGYARTHGHPGNVRAPRFRDATCARAHAERP